MTQSYHCSYSTELLLGFTDYCAVCIEYREKKHVVRRKSQVGVHVSFESLADLLGKFSLMSASGWKAVIRQADF